jgi:hypothetical protein
MESVEIRPSRVERIALPRGGARRIASDRGGCSRCPRYTGAPAAEAQDMLTHRITRPAIIEIGPASGSSAARYFVSDNGKERVGLVTGSPGGGQVTLAGGEPLPPGTFIFGVPAPDCYWIFPTPPPGWGDLPGKVTLVIISGGQVHLHSSGTVHGDSYQSVVHLPAGGSWCEQQIQDYLDQARLHCPPGSTGTGASTGGGSGGRGTRPVHRPSTPIEPPGAEPIEATREKVLCVTGVYAPTTLIVHYDSSGQPLEGWEDYLGSAEIHITFAGRCDPPENLPVTWSLGLALATAFGGGPVLTAYTLVRSEDRCPDCGY